MAQSRSSPGLVGLGFAAISAGLVLLVGLVVADQSNLPSASVGKGDGPAKPEAWVLWAWERPEDLGFLAQEPEAVTVAALVGTLRLHGDGLEVIARRNPLITAANSPRSAVIRLETSLSDPPILDDELLRKVLGAVLDLVPEPALDRVQIDFDTKASERVFYRRLLTALSHALDERHGSKLGLEITALVSWCLGDPWIEGLPIDQAIPMLFRMGPDDASVRNWLGAGRDFPVSLCRGAVGISTDEPIPPLPSHRRIHVFHPQPWTADAFRRLQADLATHPGPGARP